MAIVAGLDVHRAQITFDALDRETGEVHRGRLPATPEAVRGWARRFSDEDLHVAVEAGTGWLFVCEALREEGAIPHLAEPVETSALRGSKRRAKTDREDASWLRTLLCEGRLPEGVLLNWMLPDHAAEARRWVQDGANAAERAAPVVASYVRGAVGSGSLQRLRDEEGHYRAINDGHRKHFAAMEVPLGTVGVAASTRPQVHEKLAPYQSALDLPIVRVLANADATSLTAVADAAAP